jgi:hypothetical protein
MPDCRRCRKHYRGEPPYCDPCDEYRRSVRREEEGVVCLHCGGTFMPGGFDQHRWRVYYRDHFFPRAARRRRA